MIKKEIQKTYINNHKSESDQSKYDEQWELKEIKEIIFNKDGKIIEKNKQSSIGNLNISSGLWGFSTSYERDQRGNVIEEIWTSSLRSSETTYDNKYDNNGYLIGYDKKYIKYNNPFSRNNEDVEEKSYTTCEIENLHNTDGKLIESKKIKRREDGFIYTEINTNYNYNNDNELIEKIKDTTWFSRDNNDRDQNINKYKYYFDDKGNKVEEIKYYSKNKNSDIELKTKVIKRYDERISYNGNDDFNSRNSYYFDENDLKIKEEIHTINGLYSHINFEYEFFEE
jgi:hypothetical protein